MEDIIIRLRNYDFFKKMDFEIKSFVISDHRNGKVFMLKDLDHNKCYKVRLKHPLFPDTVKKELRVLQYMSHYSGAEDFPKIVYTDGNEEVLVTDYAEGIVLKECAGFSEEKKKKIVGKIEDKLKILHNMHSPAKDIINDLQFSNWYEWLKLIFDSYIFIVREHGYLDPNRVRFVYDFLDMNKDYLQNVQTSVIHADLKPANIIYNPETESVAIIDFESGKSGDPLFDNYRLYSDGWGYSKEYEKHPVYVLYLLNLYLRWIAYHLAKKLPIEAIQIELLEKTFSLAQKLI